jgi:hypothetical protein
MMCRPTASMGQLSLHQRLCQRGTMTQPKGKAGTMMREFPNVNENMFLRVFLERQMPAGLALGVLVLAKTRCW